MGVARIFQRGGHTDSYRGYSSDCHLNIVSCLLTRRLTKGGSRAPQDPPWLRLWSLRQSCIIFNLPWKKYPLFTASLNEVDDPSFFFSFLTSLTHHLSMLKFSEKKSMLENFRAKVYGGRCIGQNGYFSRVIYTCSSRDSISCVFFIIINKRSIRT